MEYNGIELVPIKDSQVFNPPREMLCWGDVSEKCWTQKVLAIIPSEDFPVLYMDEAGEYDGYKYCAEIPKPQKRGRTVVEKVKYLQKIESELKDDEILVSGFAVNKWSVHTDIIIHYFNDYEFAIYKSEDDIEIIEIPEIEV